MDTEERQPQFEPHRLLDQDCDAPGGQQRVEQAAIQPANDDALDREPDQRRDDEGQRDGHEDVRPEIDAREHRDVGADHDHLAMGHVDDAHRAVGDGQTQRHQEQDRAEAQADKQDFKHSRPPHLPGHRAKARQPVLTSSSDLQL